MSKDAEGYYHVENPEASAGMLYKYRLDGRLLPDPASRFQPQGVHGPSQIIDPSTFRWTDSGWRRPDIDDWVIYELHVGTFSPQGAYRAHRAAPGRRGHRDTSGKLQPTFQRRRRS